MRCLYQGKVVMNDLLKNWILVGKEKKYIIFFSEVHGLIGIQVVKPGVTHIRHNGDVVSVVLTGGAEAFKAATDYMRTLK
jgi:hypothetical protein